MTVVWIIVAVIAVVALFLMLRNYRRQADIERSDHVVPEDYE